MDNNMKLLAKIASRFNLIALIFQNFPVGACPQTPLEEVHFRHCVPKSNNLFHCHSFQWAPLKAMAMNYIMAMAMAMAIFQVKILNFLCQFFFSTWKEFEPAYMIHCGISSIRLYFRDLVLPNLNPFPLTSIHLIIGKGKCCCIKFLEDS